MSTAFWDYYMVITTDVQKNHSECLTGIDLINQIPTQILTLDETL